MVSLTINRDGVDCCKIIYVGMKCKVYSGVEIFEPWVFQTFHYLELEAASLSVDFCQGITVILPWISQTFSQVPGGTR